MAKVFLNLVVLAVLAASIAKATLLDDFKKSVHDKITECLKTNPLTEDQLATLKKHEIPNDVVVHCFLSCILKSSHFMNDENVIEKDNIIETANKVYASDPEMKGKVVDLIEYCSTETNSATISASDVACDRAAIAFHCLRDNKDKFGVSVID